MNKYIAGNLIFNCIYTTLFVTFVCGNEENSMPWWATVITAIVPSILTCLVTLFVSRKSQLNQNTEELNRLHEQLKALEKQLKSHKKKISEDIGKTINDKTLTAQHQDMQMILKKEIDTAERRYNEEEARIRNFTIEQHNMAETIEEFHLFMESWKRLAADNNDLLIRISKLEQENEQLKNQLHRDRRRNTPEL